MNPLVLVFIAVFTVVAEAESTVVIKAQDLKSLVESRNERVRARVLEKEGALEREGSFARSFLPTMELHASEEQFKKGSHPSMTQPSFGAEIKVNVFNGGRDRLESERRTLIAERRGYETVQTLSMELGKAREAYWKILYLRDYIELIQAARKNSAESLKAAERRIKAGVATETDRVEFQMQEIDLKREFERIELERNNQIRTLKVILGINADVTPEFPEGLNHEHDWQSAIHHTEADHSFLVRPAEIQAQEAMAQAVIQRRSWMPKLDVFAAYNQYNQREEENFSLARDRQESVFGLRMSMNLFDGLSGRHEASALFKEASAAKAEAKYMNQEVEAHLHGEIAELNLLHDQVHAAEENILRAEKYYQLTKSEYSRGVKNSPDMLGATEKLIGMRQKRLEIVRDFQIAKSHVLSKIGR